MARIKMIEINGTKLKEAVSKRNIGMFTYAEMIGVGEYSIKNAIDRNRIAERVLEKMSTFSKEKYRITYEEIKPDEKEDETNPRDPVGETRKTVMDKEEEILLFGMGDQNAYTPEEKKMIKVLVAANIQTFLRLTIPMETEIRRDALGTSTLIDIIERGVMAGMVRALKKDCEENGNLKKIFADALNGN